LCLPGCERERFGQIVDWAVVLAAVNANVFD